MHRQLSNMASQSVSVGKGFRRLIRFVQFIYPSVPRITSERLHHLMNNESSAKKLVLLDVREPAEIAVSRLPDSIPVSPSAKDMKKLLSIIHSRVPENHLKEVVFYCAVGWRASIMADKFMTELAKPEYHDIRQTMDLSILEGSMFKWGNERREMISGNDNSKTNLVHGVSGTFEKMLHEDVRAKR